MGKGGYIHVKEKMLEDKEIDLDEEPSCCMMWSKEEANIDGNFENDEHIDKLKTINGHIKDGTLQVDHDTNSMIVVFGKDKRGYERGVGSRERENERREHEKKNKLEREAKDKEIKDLNAKMTQTKGMIFLLVSQLATEGVNLDSNANVTSLVTPTSTIPKDGEKTTTPKLLARCKFVSSDLVLKQAMLKKKIQMNL
ncbi:unnamed protein product [Lactuca saligna]|uniref:Uncharacterized protein n=1 Tax=Lactuca saligna TaxID=75948 RepID=A0AA36E3J7_LACSI|nr:unnamed protein product [Lactuca saligna]